MYCCHCGKKIDVNKIEKKMLSVSMFQEDVDDNTEIQYVCPRCGHKIHKNVNSQELKSLSAASHAEMQRGRNFFASGMSFNLIGLIILILAIMFFVLAHKPANNYALVTNCPEFYVSIVAFVAAGILIGVGLVLTAIGLRKQISYARLLKDIQDEVFYQ